MSTSLTTKERNIQRNATIGGFRMALMPMLQARILTEPLESALRDPMISSLLKQAEESTGYAVRILLNAEGQLEWLQNDLTEDVIANVQMSNKQVMRATLGGVQLEFTVAQKSDKGQDVVDRDALVYAAQRFVELLNKLPSSTVHVPSLENGKRYVWDVKNAGGDQPDTSEPTEQSAENFEPAAGDSVGDTSLPIDMAGVLHEDGSATERSAA